MVRRVPVATRSSPLRYVNRGYRPCGLATSSCRPDLSWSRSLEPYRASWRSESNPCCPDLNPSSPRSELNDLLPHLGRTEPAVILGASAIWQGGEGPGHEALLGRAAGQARGSAFERRHSTTIGPQREPSRGGPLLDPGGGLEGVCRPVDVSPA